ncbi:MAG: FAD-binding oxidoreductase [Gemmataceae bacterium]|jgi:glycolate oxidase FAD binding subunit|nr:FAD-binding oxidoreductase [Gemmataceae bacterium]
MDSLTQRRPQTISEIGELVKQAAAEGWALYPRGGGTQFDYGYPIEKAGMIVELGEIRKVIDYPARDMTITVQAGMTLEELSQVLRQEGQELPVDIPLAERATVGGAIASNASGPRRFGWGTLRDYVIGISLINDQGVEVKGGGRVVKNVAGYDLMKLLTNSWGTLGIITQVTLKVRPLAENRQAILIPCESTDLATLWELVRTTKTRPVAFEILSPEIPLFAADTGSGWRVSIAFEDNTPSVVWQVKTFLSELPAALEKKAQIHSEAKYLKSLNDLTDFPFQIEQSTVLKVNDRPSRVVEFALSFAENFPCHVLGRAGNGILYVILKQGYEQEVGSIQSRILQQISPEGNCIIQNCSEQVKRNLLVWGKEKPDWGLMRAVKKALDPQGIFSPNRFVGRI